ncbi:hypothetical protein A2U01_0085752, partial [Trifolium medium]|nr:hypothetical protein [Trifolium medium]
VLCIDTVQAVLCIYTTQKHVPTVLCIDTTQKHVPAVLCIDTVQTVLCIYTNHTPDTGYSHSDKIPNTAHQESRRI